MPSDSETTEFRGGAGGQHDRLQRLGRYQIQRKLGAGGMGTVFLAVDRELNRTVALKVLPRERAENHTLVRRFKAEAQAAAQLEHKNIVRVYDAGEIDGFLYIAMEYVDGIDVHELVAKRGVLPVKRSIDIVKQVARALDHASSKQIVHRDIKPANLMIKRDGTVKLADMGLARSIDESIETSITRPGMTVGTVDYMSPEQARSSQSADVRSDIYSLGCTWYHMLTGFPPFPDGGLTEKLQAHALGKRPDPRVENDAVPESVVAVMHRMMARKPQDRYQTPKELLDDLELASKTLTTLDATILEALADEAEPPERSKARTGSRSAGGGKPGSGPAPLPPKDLFKPVDLTTGRKIDIDVLRVAAPAVLVIALLSAIVWFVQQADDANVGGLPADTFPGVVQQQGGGGEDRHQGDDDSRNADEPADGEALDDVASLAGAAGPNAGPAIVGTFPGAEDASTTASGLPLVPNWVDSFRQPEGAHTHQVVVTRRASGAGQFRRLNAALDALPRDGGVIELDGEGPFVLEPTSVISRGRIHLTAAAGRQPVVVLSSPDGQWPGTGFLSVPASQLEIDNVHFVIVDPTEMDGAILRIESGDVALRNCSMTVRGGEGTFSAVLIDGQERSGTDRRRAAAPPPGGRCLLENVVCRGPSLTAVHLQGGGSELVAGNCLIHSGDAPAIRVTDPGDPGAISRNLRLLACTILSGRSAVQFLRDGDRAVGDYEIVVRRSLIAAADVNDPADAMFTLERWPEQSSNIGTSRASGVNWSSEETSYVGWPVLVRLSGEDGAPLSEVTTADQWRPFWNKALSSDAVRSLSELPPAWQQAETIVPGDVSPDRWTSLTDAPHPLSAGCRPAGFVEIPWGLIDHVTAASRAPDVPHGFGPLMEVDESPVSFDLSSRRSLEILLENDTACPDGAHVIASGSGLHKLEPIEIADKSIRLEFRHSGGAPLMIQFESGRGQNEAPQAALTVRNGSLDLVGAHFKIPATSSRSQPPWLIRLEGGGVSIRQCTLEGPSTLSAAHSGLIQIAADGPGDLEVRPCVLIEDSFLVSPGVLLSGPVRWETMILRNSVLVSLRDVLHYQLEGSAMERASTVVIDHCTFAAGQSVFRFEGSAPPDMEWEPLQFIVTACLFTAAATGEETSASVVARESEQQTDHFVQWWGNANGFASTLSRYVSTGGSGGSPGSFLDVWTSTWGRGHEAHPLFALTDVVLAATLPAWTQLQPSSFALNATSPAATWASDLSPIGARLSEVGAQTDRPAGVDDRSPNQEAPPKGSRSVPRRTQNRNPF